MSSFFCENSKPAFQTFEDVQAHLDKIGLFHIDMGLERMKTAIRLLNVHIPCPIVQVVGTNGKGSTASFLHSIALANGFRAGIFTSPHFISPIERIRMNDRLLPKTAWAMFANQALAAVPDLTYFELLTIISLLAFTFSEPDLLIYEAGLGGQYDATTAIDTDLLCVSPIDIDHTAFLGNTIQSIAKEKSHAIRKNMFAVVSAPQSKDVWDILEERAHSLDIPLYSSKNIHLLPQHTHINHKESNYNDLGLKGEHQSNNAQTALMAWQLLCQKQGWHFEPKAVAEGLTDAFIPGRFQQIKKQKNLPAFILDGAHNAHSMKSLIATLEQENIKPSAFIFSCLEDKEPHVLVELMDKYLFKHNLEIPILIPQIINNDRAIQASELSMLFKNKTHVCTHFTEALKLLPTLLPTSIVENPTIICGSLYLLADYYTLFPQALQTSF